MALLHRTHESPIGILDELEHPTSGIRLQIARQGAEMISFQARNSAGHWSGFLHRDGDPTPPSEGWANHATVMGYFLHRLWHEQSIYRGKTIRGGNHGFLRHFQFAAPTLESDALCYRVNAAAIPPEAYPLRVALELRYRPLTPSGLEVEFLFLNQEPELTAHLSFGLHPGFAIPQLTPDALLLPPGTYQRHLAPGNFLNGQIESISHPGGPMPFPVSELPGSFILGLADVPDRIFTLRSAASGWLLKLDFSECPFVTLWSEGSDYLCVEPCWGLPDSLPQTPFEDKPGIQFIFPGGSLKKSFRLLATPAN